MTAKRKTRRGERRERKRRRRRRNTREAKTTEIPVLGKNFVNDSMLSFFHP
jgi:hypothetical protein